MLSIERGVVGYRVKIVKTSGVRQSAYERRILTLYFLMRCCLSTTLNHGLFTDWSPFHDGYFFIGEAVEPVDYLVNQFVSCRNAG